MADFWDSVGDLFGNVLKGAMKSLEGIYDFHAGTVGFVGGWFDDEFEKDVREHITYDWTEDNTQFLKGTEKNSVFGDTVRNIAGGVGGMLPSVALSFIPYAGPALSQAALMTGAAGNSMESSLKEGADYTSAFLYGVGKGVVEGATEKLGGFVLGKGGSVLGKATAGTSFGNAVSKGVGKVAFDAASEGAEEVVSDVVIDPGLKYVTGVDDNIGENYKQAIEDAPEIFGTGVAVGSIMQGGTTAITNIANSAKGRGGAKATRADNAVQNIGEITKLYNENRDDNFRYDAAVRQNLSAISQELVKMTPQARKKYLESIGAVDVEGKKSSFLKGAFNEDGTMSTATFEWFRNAGTNAPKNQYYSHGVAGKRSAMQSDMEKITRELRDSYARNKGVSLEEAERAVSDVKIYEGELSAKEQKEFSKFKEGFTALNQISGDGLSFVMIDSNSEINGTIVDGKTVYIGKDNFENGQWAKTLVHEYTHFAEGTPEYESLLRLLVRNSDFANKVDEAMSQMGYGFDYDKILDIEKKQVENKELTTEDEAYYNAYKSELMAHMSEELLGNERFIENLVVQNKSLAAKVLHKIKNLLSSLGNIKNDNARAQHRFLKNAENLYLNAIHRAGYKSVNGRIVEDEEKGQNEDSKEGEGVAFARKKRYNNTKAKIARYIPYDKIGKANVEVIRRKLLSIYAGTDNTIADGIAIEHGKKIYVVDSGKENGKINFGVRKAISISNPILRQERLDKINERAISDGYVSGELFGQFKRASNNSSGSSIRREPREELSADTGQSQDNQERVPGENGDRGRNLNSDIKLSRKSQGETFEEVPGGVKVHFNDFVPWESNDNSNDLAPKGSSSRENEAWGYAAAERARQESLDALLKNGEPPRYSPISADKDTELLRRVVNNTKAKKYTRADVKAIVTELLNSEGYFGDNTVVMKGKKRAELEKMLWQALNTKGKGELGGAALDAAEYIIQNAIAVEYLEVTDDVQLAVQFVDALKPYLHNMNLDFIKGDIKAKFDKDNTPYLMWAVKKDGDFRGYTADEVAQELEALGFRIDKTSEADIFLEINELYRLAKQTITDAVPTKDTLLNALGTKKAKKLKQALAKDILAAQEEKGTETSFYKLQQKYIKQIAELGDKVKTAHKRNTLENRILKEAKKIYDSNKHTFANATEVQTEALKNIKSLLSRVNSREQVNRSSLRAIMKELAIWYSEKNPVLEGFYDNYIAEHLAYFAETVGEDVDARDTEGVVPYEAVKKMDSVKTVTGQEFAKGETDLVTQVENYYKSLGSKVTNEELGEVLIDKRGIKDDIAHGIGRKKAATFAAVPDVIQRGKVVDYQKNWKGRNYDTAVIAAPITVGTEKHYMGVVVIQNKENNRFYVHEVVEIKNEGAQPFKTGPVEKNSNAGGDAPSVISILQKIANYNSESENSQNVKREKPLSMGELEMVQVILHHMNHVFENFGKMWRGGKYVEASDVASAQYDKLKEAEANHSSFEKAILHNRALRYIMDPMAVLAAWDGHDPDGYFTTTYREFAEGLIGQRWDEMQALAEFDEFRKTHKKYFKTLTNGKDKIKVSGRIDPRNLTVSEIEIPKNVAIDLYMVSKTGQAIVTLEEVGYKVRIDGQHEQETMQTITKAQIEEMYNKFSEEDKELISIMERAYNGYCRDLKYNTDMKRLGFSNVFEGYYYPINRIGATDFDTDNFFQMMERVSNISANKSRVKGAKNAIIASNALVKFMRHVNAVARYANLAIPVENMNRVFNLDISGDKHMPTSIKMKLSENALWKGAEDYMKRLTDDVQQIGIKPDGGSKTIAWLRGNYAKFQLGANPKVWFTQLSSYFAAFGELRASSLARAVAIDGSDVDKYCRLAAIRHYDKAATKAQSLTDKTGNVLTAPIEAVDRGVIRKLFAACQAEAQARYKLEIGTEENKIKAGEILTEVILKTQQNQLITEQSAAMRSTSEIIKSFTMFSADSMKLLSRFVQYMGEVATLNKRIKAAKARGDSSVVEQLTAQRNRAVKSLLKSSASILAVSVWMAALAKLFKLLYNKDDEEETVAEWLGEGTVGNIIGMVPFVRDVYSYFADGYDTDIFVTSMANDVLKSVSKTRDIFTAWVSGKEVTSEEFYSNIRSLAYSFSQIFGLPTRNVYNFTTGIIRRIDEGTGKSIDAWFKEPSESDAKESLREGIEDRDESLTNYGLNQMYKKYEIEASDKALKSEFDRLLKLNATKDEDDNTDYSPLGFKIPENLEIDGEDVELSAEDRKVFKNGLKSAEKSSAAMVKTYYYRQLGDKYKAYAMRKVFEYYDLVARYEVAGGTDGRGRPSLQYYGEAVGIDVLAVLMAYKQELNGASDAEKAKRTKSTKELITEYLNKFNLTPVQKSLVLRALGYSDKDNDKLVKAFIERRPGLSREQRAEFLEIAKIA